MSSPAGTGYDLEAAVGLLIADNTAFTARSALRALGYQELDEVRRATLYRLQLDRTARSPEDVVAALMRAEVLFNPNKHQLSYAGVHERSSLPDSTEGRAAYEAVVFDLDDDSSRLASLLQEHFGLTELSSLSRGIAWTLFEGGAGAGADRHRWACAQLLCNPYSQSFEVRQAPLRSVVRELVPRPANQGG